ncbi:hypothetical protein GCM10009603_59440 [Nocardiopsis exhalans]
MPEGRVRIIFFKVLECENPAHLTADGVGSDTEGYQENTACWKAPRSSVTGPRSRV